jgi:hypothetical protein
LLFFHWYLVSISILVLFYRNDPQKLAEKLEQLTSSKTVTSKTPVSEVSSKFSAAAPCPKKPEAQDSKARFMHSKTKELNSIMKTELLEDKNFEEIKQVLLIPCVSIMC